MQLRTFLRLLGVLLALALAYTAQYLFQNPDRGLGFLAAILPFAASQTFVVACGGLLLGAILFAAAAPSARPPADQSTPPPAAPLSPAALTLIFLGLTVYAFNMGLYLGGGESSLVRWLWAASLALLILSQARPAGLANLARRWRSDWRLYRLPALLLLLALALRLYRLTALPQNLHGDMASHGLQARLILAGQTGGVIGVGWADIPLIGFLPAVITMRLTGDSGLWGLNLASAVGGVLSVWGLYTLLSQITRRRVALIAMTLLAVSFAHIHFSRIAEYIDPLPPAIWSLALLVYGLRGRSRLAFLLSGLLLALAGLMYYAGRVMIVVVVIFLLYLLLTDRRRLRDNRQGLLFLAAGFLAALGPMLIYFAMQPGELLSRSQAVFLFNPAVLTHLADKYNVSGVGAILGEQLRRSLLMFNFYPDSSTQFAFPGPIVDPYTAPLVALGFGFAVAHWRRPGHFLLASFLAAVLVSGGVLTNNAPFWPRLVIILLPAAALMAVAVDRVWDAIAQASNGHLNYAARILVVGALVYVGLQNWLLYYPFAAHNGQPRALVGRFVGSLPPETPVCLAPEAESDVHSWIHSVEEREIAFFLPPRPGFDVPLEQLDRDSAAEAMPAACSQPGAVWIVPETRQVALSRLKALFPGGQVDSHGPRLGRVDFFSYQLAPEQ